MAIKPKPTGFIRTKSSAVHPEKGKKFQNSEFHPGHKATNAASQTSDGKKFSPISKRSQTEANRPEVLGSYQGSSNSGIPDSNKGYSSKNFTSKPYGKG